MPLDITTLRRAQKYRKARQQEHREVAEHLEEAGAQAIEARTHRAFVADLPRLTGTAAQAPQNVRATHLQRDLEHALAANDALRAVVLDLMELAADRPELLARARAAYLRSVL